jgi:hypothetical protein
MRGQGEIPKFGRIPDLTRFSKRFTDNGLCKTSIRDLSILNVFKGRDTRDVTGALDLSELRVLENLRVGHFNCGFGERRGGEGGIINAKIGSWRLCG